MPNFCANLTWLFQEHEFLDRFAAAADAGFTAVEYLFPYDYSADDIAARLVRHKLKAVLLNVAPGDVAAGERGLSALPDRKDDFRKAVKAARLYADTAGCTRVHLMASIASGPEALATYKDSIRYTCEALHDLTVLLEPINNRDIPGYLLNDFNLAEQIITELKLPNLRFQFDIYHRQILHGDVIRGLERLMPIIDHMQIASVPGRNEPTTGELDDALVLKTIDAMGYSGYIGCEYKPATTTLEGLSWMKSFIGQAAKAAVPLSPQ
ncbi:MAG: TIM barrel protein [Alphaproteobacteria bacterium]|nr:TIM barrel protein [Alphaproteobacteria bacterium]